MWLGGAPYDVDTDTALFGNMVLVQKELKKSPLSVCFIPEFPEQWMFVQNFMANEPLVVEIFRSGPQLWYGSHTASIISKAIAANMAKCIRTKAKPG